MTIQRTFPRRSRAAAFALVAGVLIASTLTACMANPLETVVEGVTGGNVDLGGANVPDDFPADIPLYDGEVVQGLGVGAGAGKSWTVIVKVPDATAIDTIRTQLEGVGLTSEFEQAGGGALGAAFSNDTYGVVVGITGDGNKGFVATYLVTPKPSQ